MTINNKLKTFKKGQKVLVRADKDHPWILGRYYPTNKPFDPDWVDPYHYVVLEYHGFYLPMRTPIKDESNILPYNNETKIYEGIVGGPENED